MNRERAYLDLSGLIAGIQVRQGPEFLFTFIFNGMAIRKSATFFDDQYKFYKELKSEKLMIAFVEYMFEGINPSGLNSLEQTVFDSLKVRMDNQKQKANAGAKGGKNSHGGGRSKKQTENNEKTTKEQAENKQKTSKKQTEKQAKNKEDKDIVSKDTILSISRSKSISNNISISKDIETETKVSGYGNEDVNKCLDLISSYNGGIVDGTKQNGRRYSKLLIDKLNKLDSIKSGKYTWYDTLEIILKIISKNKYYASKITSPENIYRNLSVLMQQCKTDIGKANTSSIVLSVV